MRPLEVLLPEEEASRQRNIVNVMSLHKPWEANLERWKYLGQFLGLKGTVIQLTPNCLKSSPFPDIQIKSNTFFGLEPSYW